MQEFVSSFPSGSSSYQHKGMAEQGPQESWKAQLSMDFAEMEGHSSRRIKAEWKFHFGRYFHTDGGGEKHVSKDILKVHNCVQL